LAGAPGVDLLRHAHLYDVAEFAPFDQSQNALFDEPPHGVAHRSGRKADIVRQPENREVQPQLAFQAAVAQQMRIDRAVDHRHAQPRGEHVFKLFPHSYGVEFLAFHGHVSKAEMGIL
jgi:hypothetical protein